MDIVEESWRVVGPILDRVDEPLLYPTGSWGPEEAEKVALYGHWHPLEMVDS
jgi:glucose-6-phosphate 1-dehydrogenase